MANTLDMTTGSDVLKRSEIDAFAENGDFGHAVLTTRRATASGGPKPTVQATHTVVCALGEFSTTD